MNEYCDCIEQFNEKLGDTKHTSPFTEMFFIVTQPTATVYAICVPQRTPRGNWSQRKQTNILMRHCPFCGTELPLPPAKDKP